MLKTHLVFIKLFLFLFAKNKTMSSTVENQSISKPEQTSNQNNSKPEQSKLIEPAVNKSPQNSTEPKTLSNIENHSIINQKQNEIPSLKESPKSHKQIQSSATNPTQKNLTSVQPEPPVQTNQSQQSVKKIQKTSNNSPSNQTEAHPSKSDTNKIQPSSQSSKAQIESKKSIQSKKQPAKNQAPAPKLEGSSVKVQSSQKIAEIPANTNTNQTQESTAKKQEQKSSKELQSTKDVKKEEQLHQEKTNSKPSEKSIAEKVTQKNLNSYKSNQAPKEQHPKPIKEQHPKPAENKVIDSHHANSTKTLQEGTTKQVEGIKNSEKQIIKPKQIEPNKKQLQKKPQIPEQSQGISFNELLKLLLQKCKQRQEKEKNKVQPKSKAIQGDSIDLKLSLAPSNQSKESYQSRIKLELKLIQSSDQKKTESIKVASIPENVENQPSRQEHTEAQKQSPQTKEKLQDVKVAFYLYNLKNLSGKETTENQKNKPEDKQTLQNKLQQVTKTLDKNLFSFKVSLKDEAPEQKNKLPLKTVKFSFEPLLIASSLQIKPQRLQNLKTIILSTLGSKLQTEQTSTNDKEKTQSENKGKKQKKIDAKNAFAHISSAELSLSSPLKELESTKLLAWVSNGFKMRIQSRRQSQKEPSRPHYLEKVFRQVIVGLAPSLLTQYLVSISSGSANVNFRSIKNLTSLLTRLGINEIFDETPSVKEVLKELVQIHLKSLFSVKSKIESSQKKPSQQIQGISKNETKGQMSFLYKAIETVFHEANCHGISVELIIYQRMSIKLTLECGSSRINELWNFINK